MNYEENDLVTIDFFQLSNMDMFHYFMGFSTFMARRFVWGISQTLIFILKNSFYLAKKAWDSFQNRGRQEEEPRGTRAGPRREDEHRRMLA
mmetsp:Transcript_9695/g.14765  ORF Transcript_9695/g.14765 Transcript_9695/m.14765 type:complete len:91 (-) Transcript_9695:54-326(-)